MKNRLIIISSAVALICGLGIGYLLFNSNGEKIQLGVKSSSRVTNNSNTVAKTGICKTGQVRRLVSGTYTVGVDMASGEYRAQGEVVNDVVLASFTVFLNKDSYTQNEYGGKETSFFTDKVSKDIKLDNGNYINVAYAVKLTCL